MDDIELLLLKKEFESDSNDVISELIKSNKKDKNITEENNENE